jgi:hypothetical protein
MRVWVYCIAAVLAATTLADCGRASSDAGKDAASDVGKDTAPKVPKISAEQLRANTEARLPVGKPVIRNAAVQAPDGSMTADVLELKYGEGIAFMETGKSSPTVNGQVYLWGPEGKHVVIQLVDWSQSDPTLVEHVDVTLTPVPTEYKISRTFPNSDDSIRFQIIMQDPEGVVNVWNPRVARKS